MLHPTINPKILKIPGWFSKRECLELYNLAHSSPGPILEIGHFLGRSTACICQAIHNSHPKTFYSYDMGFTSSKDFQTFYLGVYKELIPVPQPHTELFSRNLMSTDIAFKNLQKLNLAEYVKLISGNFTSDQEKYQFIFCDAMHTPKEINYNLPHIVEKSNNNCIWAFHDMNKENIKAVLSFPNVVFSKISDSLGVFIFKKTL
jgi:hypothetical protein